jgi:hypothetical protein
MKQNNKLLIIKIHNQTAIVISIMEINILHMKQYYKLLQTCLLLRASEYPAITPFDGLAVKRNVEVEISSALLSTEDGKV